MQTSGEGVWLRRELLTAGGLVLAGLVGCASSSPIDVKKPIPSGQGAVFLKLLTDGRGDPDFADWVVSAVVYRVGEAASNESRRVRLMRSHDATHSSALLCGLVASGRYFLGLVETEREGRRETFHLEPELLQFDVMSGLVTLLGTLLVQAVRDPLTSLKYLRPEADMSRSPESAFSTWGSATRAKPFFTPLPTAKLETASQGADEFKSRSVPARSGEQLPNGDFVSGSRLGRYFVRKRGSSRWQPVDVGAWGEVLSVRRHGDGLLVAGEDGLLRSSTDEGSSWKALPPPGPGLIRVAQTLRDGRVVALVRNAAQWSVHLTDDLASDAWHKLAGFAFEELPGDHQPLPMLVSVGDKLGLMLSNGSFCLVNPQSGQVTQSPGFARVNALASTPDGLLVMRAYRSGNVTLASYDEGLTWIDVALPRSTIASAFKDKRTAYAVAALAGAVTTPQFGIFVSRDGALTWSRTGTSAVEPDKIAGLSIDRLDGALLLQLRDGAVMRSADEGAAWKREP